ncbi:DUF4143 domain-containing protein [Glutamicibacter sp. PS]|uniref:ATP-binding protein n=1 Tax=Glutamicibacter sp. PS TaxID=3075634 RepID=UPI0028475CBB|nr:DUF4143 domain-containing protein [Glutamicibacter sp. PS]MDR4534182.1 DUF4143 domain-containing protein [Glutamicibacter sp. PS]
MEYLPRVVDQEISELQAMAGAILIEGARACGKSATGRHHSRSHIQLDIDQNARRLAEIDESLLLDGDKPRFIDEWQVIPGVWNQVRASVDSAQTPGQYVLAGSAVPADDHTRHSGAGRILRMRMRPMSLFESGQSSGQASLKEILAGGLLKPQRSPLTVRALAERTVIGGWPGLQRLGADQAQRFLRSYLADVARVDLPALEDEPRRDAARTGLLIRSLARSVGTEASFSTISADMGPVGGLSARSVSAYHQALERIFVVEDQPAWSPKLRSKDRIRAAVKRHFVDPSLGAAALGAGPDRLLGNLEYFGQLFESLVVRDLRIYTQASGGHVMHVRDSRNREIDAIIEFPNGQWAALEIKLGANAEDRAAQSLTAFIDNVDQAASGPPLAKIIVTGGEFAYTRPDGIHVVPIGLLGP